jgi:hypothetical protein
MKATEIGELIQVLEARVEKNEHRPAGIAWADARVTLEGHDDALKSLHAMEAQGW